MKSTCDISDQLHPNVQYLDPIFKSYGVKTAFSGRIVTIKCFEDNSLVEEALKMNGKGCVLVVDAGESLRCAMLGDKRASDAIKNNETGIICDGNNLEEIYSSIDLILKNNSYLEMGKKAKEYSSKFDWGNIIKEYLRIL